ncbi:hypothetical protein B4U80_14494 [Leptotrombidium deliense]|uniref:C2 domain-containing protein n=1 Tax=Leptotrombidium deliense TaxID=299467 RepID=A0A443RVA1_9ACAR|nr:hypothetical protein B4U80_14494 [Leptotrombidium deliense]
MSCKQCYEYLKSFVIEDAELFDVIKQDIDDKNVEKNKNTCSVKIQFALRTQTNLAIDVFRCVNIPIFKQNEIPESQVIIELWKSNTKVTQRSTEFKLNTRDPSFGRRFLFTISDGNIQRHFIRVLVATKKRGWLKNTISLVAETFIGIPKLEVRGSAHYSWYKMTIIGMPFAQEPKPSKN